MFKQLVLNKLNAMRSGAILFKEGSEERYFGEGIPVVIEVYDPRFYPEIALRGTVGAAVAYAKGWWHTKDLRAVFQLALENPNIIQNMEKGFSKCHTLFQSLKAKLSPYTHQSAKANILAHYDLGNDFYRLFLDPTMMYSCGVYPNADSSLHEASLNKLAMICDSLALKPTDHILEIGTGWGGFAMYAASHYGCKVTTTTISDAQYGYAKSQVAANGLADRITVLNQDFRDLTGTYDHVVSIEMIEAIGHSQFQQFFDSCAARLNEGGALFIQAITMNEQQYDRAKDEVDFIRKFIFPGGCLPSLSAMLNATRKAPLRLDFCHDIGKHYARTLSDWHERFESNLDAIKAQGFDEGFIRMWRYYFKYCEAAFAKQYIGDLHVKWQKTSGLVV